MVYYNVNSLSLIRYFTSTLSLLVLPTGVKVTLRNGVENVSDIYRNLDEGSLSDEKVH